MNASALTLSEAVPLGYVLVDEVAQRRGLRSLAIKGPVLEAQGLRSGHASVDVDVWVHPDDADLLARDLVVLGWRRAAASTTAKIVPLHSTTLAHPAWPSEIDLHVRFPGFLGDPAAVFEALWARRCRVGMADSEVTATDPVGSAAVAALHLLRDPERRRAELDILVSALARTLEPGQLRDLAALAEVTESTEPMRPVLVALGVGPHVSGSDDDVPGLREWTLRTRSSGRHSVAWVHEFASTPIVQWPAVLRRALLLTEPELRHRFPHARRGRLGLMQMRVQRLWVGLRALPGAVAAVRRHRRSASGR